MKDEILQRHPAVARWHQRIVSERFEKVKKLLTGEELYLSTDQPEYAALLETLVLDPPEDASTRDVVCKQAIRRLPPQMLVPLFEKGLYPGSPNGKEIQKACSLLLALRKEALGPSLAARVEELTKKVIE